MASIRRDRIIDIINDEMLLLFHDILYIVGLHN